MPSTTWSGIATTTTARYCHRKCCSHVRRCCCWHRSCWCALSGPFRTGDECLCLFVVCAMSDSDKTESQTVEWRVTHRVDAHRQCWTDSMHSLLAVASLAWASSPTSRSCRSRHGQRRRAPRLYSAWVACVPVERHTSAHAKSRTEARARWMWIGQTLIEETAATMNVRVGAAIHVDTCMHASACWLVRWLLSKRRCAHSAAGLLLPCARRVGNNQTCLPRATSA